MRNELEIEPKRPSLVRRAFALLVLLAVAALAIHLIIGMIMAVVWVLVAFAAVAAVLWALKTLVW